MATSRAKKPTSREPASYSIVRLFPNRALLDVLGLLLLHPGEEFYQSEMVRRTGSTLLQVQRALQRIKDAGLLQAMPRGNRVYYTAVQDHPVYEELKGMLLKTVALGDAVRDGLEPVRDKILAACIFGSVAAGAESAASDVDLLIVGEVNSRRLAGILGPLGRALGREINQAVYPPAEFRRKVRRNNRFLTDLLAGPQIWLIGDRDDLARLAQ